MAHLPDKTLTIVMYHYVRRLVGGDWSRIRGLETARFQAQLDHIARQYDVVGEADVAAAWAGDADLPPRACWLTFDDGFIDHYETVFPRLADRGWPASFFPSAGPVLTGRLLDVHRVHFILASQEDPGAVYAALVKELAPIAGRPAHVGNGNGDGSPLPSMNELHENYFAPNRFDPAEVIFIKRVLQVGLPEAIRSAICGRLFARFVSADEADFAASLYMSLPQMREMAGVGMNFGGHGVRHRWMGDLNEAGQREEIDGSLDLLERIIGRRPRGWTMCYPYGSYNARTLELLADADCRLGLTTRFAVATLADAPLQLPRLDTNDLPCGDAHPATLVASAKSLRR